MKKSLFLCSLLLGGLSSIGQTKVDVNKFVGTDLDPNLYPKVIIGIQNHYFRGSQIGLNAFYRLNDNIEFQGEVGFYSFGSLRGQNNNANDPSLQVRWVEFGGTYYFKSWESTKKRRVMVGSTWTTDYFVKLPVPSKNRFGVRGNLLYDGFQGSLLGVASNNTLEKFNTTYLSLGLAYNIRTNGEVSYEDYGTSSVLGDWSLFADVLLPLSTQTGEISVAQNGTTFQEFSNIGYRFGTTFTRGFFSNFVAGIGLEYLILRGVSTIDQNNQEQFISNNGIRFTARLQYAL